MAAFVLKNFEEAFAASLDMLRNAESTTKRELRALSRTVLEAHHATGQIAYINALIGVLTPMNRAVAVLYFKAFSGYHYSEKDHVFTKKNALIYGECKTAADELLADPNKNIWTWAEINVKTEANPFDAKKVQAFMKSQIKKAAADGLETPKADVLRAVFQSGQFTLADVTSLLDVFGAEAVKADAGPRKAEA